MARQENRETIINNSYCSHNLWLYSKMDASI